MVVNISLFKSISRKLNSQNHALEIQKEIIDSIKAGNPFSEVIKDNKEMIAQWYIKGRKGNELYTNFYNQLNQLAKEDIIFEDLVTIVESVKESKEFLKNRQYFILFNSPQDIDEWYIKGRDGDKTFKWFYNSIKEYAFQDVIKYDEKLLNNLLNDGLDLNVALSSPKLFSTKKEFKENDYGSIKPLVEKNSKEAIINGLKNGKQFTDLIESENIYNTPEEIRQWYEKGRNGNPNHKDFYKNALPYVVKQDYNKVSEAINKGTPIEELLSLPSIMSSKYEFQEYLQLQEDESFGTFIEQDTQKAILNSCMAGVPFKKAIKDVFKFNSKDIEIWYKLGRGGDSQYKDFFDKISPFVLKDDCETILNAVQSGKSLNEAIEESELISSKEAMKQLYSKTEFDSGGIANIVNKTIDVLVFNTNFSSSSFDFNAKSENINQWVELGKLNIFPFKKFYDEYLIYKTQIKIIQSLKDNELFFNSINNTDLAYKPDEILEWFFKGKNGEKYVEFYNQCSKYTINETKQLIINHLSMYHSFDQAIEQFNKLYNEDEIREWFNQGKNGEDHIEFYETSMEIMSQFKGSINSLDELLTLKYEEKLKSASLSVEDYDKIINEIYQLGKPFVKFDEKDSIFEKISIIVNAYAPWSYKSRGGESGSYMSNFIKLDDRLLDSQKISTLIHELTHHLVAEILEIAMCYMLDVDKTQAIEGFVAFFLTDPLSKIMNEYCASTVEGRFIPHGFQNYGAFDIAMKECNAEESIKELYTYIGNTFADDIISILEKFIDEDLRRDIKNQFIEDRFPPRYEGIDYECSQTIPKDVIISLLSDALIDYYNLAKNSESHKEILEIAYRSFNSSYQ